MPIRFINLGITKYPIVLIDMEIAQESVAHGADECIFITEHEALYSAGKSFELRDFIMNPKYPVYFPKRGGRVTVHSPGQLVIYPVINLKKRNLNVHEYVELLESWIMKSLNELNINSHLSEKGVGVWVDDCKIGFIGIRIEHGITTHGLCLNVSNDLAMFNAIVPCGINGVKITSIEKLNKNIKMIDVSAAFKTTCPF